MSTIKTPKNVTENQPTGGQTVDSTALFGPKNFIMMGVGVALMILGYFLMIGGSSDANPDVFNAEEKYSFMRITVAPLLILAGLIIQIPAILLRNK